MSQSTANDFVSLPKSTLLSLKSTTSSLIKYVLDDGFCVVQSNDDYSTSNTKFEDTNRKMLSVAYYY